MKKSLAFSILTVFFVFTLAVILSFVPKSNNRTIASIDHNYYIGHVNNQIPNK